MLFGAFGDGSGWEASYAVAVVVSGSGWFWVGFGQLPGRGSLLRAGREEQTSVASGAGFPCKTSFGSFPCKVKHSLGKCLCWGKGGPHEWVFSSKVAHFFAGQALLCSPVRAPTMNRADSSPPAKQRADTDRAAPPPRRLGSPEMRFLAPCGVGFSLLGRKCIFPVVFTRVGSSGIL